HFRPFMCLPLYVDVRDLHPFPTRRSSDLGNITFSPEKYKLIAQRMVLEAGVSLYFHSYLTGCRKSEDGRLTHVINDNKNGAEARSEEHTSELQSREYLVRRLLLEKYRTL